MSAEVFTVPREAPTLREAYADERLQRIIGSAYLVPLEDMLAATDEWADHPDKMEYLDSLVERRDRVSGYASQLLSQFDPEFIFENYGENVLVWAAAHPSSMRRGENFRNALGELAGYDPELFESIRLWCWQRDHANRGQDILTQYEVAEKLLGGMLEDIELSSILQAAARPGVELSDGRLDRYDLIPLRSEASSARPDGWEVNWSNPIGNLNYAIWLDAPSGFALTYRGAPQAVVAVAASPRRQDELMIYQLQGVRPGVIGRDEEGSETIVGKRSSRGLMPLDWQKAMIDVAEAVAAGLGKQSVCIQAGRNNYWIDPKFDKEPHLTPKEARRAYDKPAKRLGFKKGKDGNWHRLIQEARVKGAAIENPMSELHHQ